jgi:hypothetical protein
MKPVSEKAAEILFNRFLLQSFPLGKIELFAPSSIEEFQKGYDSKVAGHKAFREMYLQFKSPSYSERWNLFTITLTSHQHAALKNYPPNSAYYVSPMFRSLGDLNAAQRDLTMAKDFLRYFVCIEISRLPHEVNFCQFIAPGSNRESPQVKYKIPEDGNTRRATHTIQGLGWLRGSGLLEKFRNDEIGTKVTLEHPPNEEGLNCSRSQSGEYSTVDIVKLGRLSEAERWMHIRKSFQLDNAARRQ